MVRSDRSQAGGRRIQWRHWLSVSSGTDSPDETRRSVEAILRMIVAGIGVALLAIAFRRLLTDVGLETIVAVLGSTAVQWLVLVVFGCVLIVAALRNRPSNAEWQYSND